MSKNDQSIPHKQIKHIGESERNKEGMCNATDAPKHGEKCHQRERIL